MENSQPEIRTEQNLQGSASPVPISADAKKAPHATLFVLFVVILGFGAAAACFAYFTKGTLVKKPLPSSAKSAPAKTQTIVEVAAPSLPLSPQTTASMSVEKTIPAFNLSGILFGEQGSLALINGKVVKLGGTVEGAVVKNITANSVELDFDNKKITLKAH